MKRFQGRVKRYLSRNFSPTALQQWSPGKSVRIGRISQPIQPIQLSALPNRGATVMSAASQAIVDLLAPHVERISPDDLSFATSADASLRVMKAVDKPGRSTG